MLYPQREMPSHIVGNGERHNGEHTPMSNRVAFVGLGAMGEPMAANLIGKGRSVVVVGHRRPEPLERLRALGAAVAASPAEAARDSAFVVLMLPSSSEVERVMEAPGGVLESA